VTPEIVDFLLWVSLATPFDGKPAWERSLDVCVHQSPIFNVYHKGRIVQILCTVESRLYVVQGPKGKIMHYWEWRTPYIVSYGISPGSEGNFYCALSRITHYLDSLYRDDCVFSSKKVSTSPTVDLFKVDASVMTAPFYILWALNIILRIKSLIISLGVILFTASTFKIPFHKQGESPIVKFHHDPSERLRGFSHTMAAKGAVLCTTAWCPIL